MILKSLHLKNYRTYKNPDPIYFADGKKNVTIIKGNNEVGKTTIMNAITWCLYGRELYKQKGHEPIFSKTSARELSVGDEDKVEVKLIMEDEKGKEVKFVRELTFYKNDLGKCVEDVTDSKILIDDIPVSYPKSYISKHLPIDVRKYFLFDGEQLESYFDEDNIKIKNSVYHLSHLNVLEKVKKHLKSCEKYFTDELEDSNPILAKLYRQEQEILDAIDSNGDAKEKIDININKWDALIKSYSDRIKRFGEDVEDLINEKNQLQATLDEIDKNIENNEIAYGDFLVDNMANILSINALLDVKNICKDLEEKGYIPARYKKEFIKYLLDQHECICGADLSEGSEAHNKMVEIYEKTDSITDIADKVNLLLGNLNNIVDNFPLSFSDDLISKLNDIEKSKSKREEIDRKINEINIQIGEVDEDEVKRLQNLVLEYEELIKVNDRKFGELSKQIDIDLVKLDDLKKDIIKEEKKQEERLKIQSSIDLCKSAQSEIKSIYEELEDDIHNKLEELTSLEFGSMHWKEFYEGVEIDKNYNVFISKNGEVIVPNDLSKGGQLVLALSFMTVLNSLSGFGLPIVIDTPLGRLDEPIKENIGKYIPEYTKGKQLTLLVTGSEYSDEFKAGIRDYVGKEYELEYIQEDDGITNIKTKK